MLFLCKKKMFLLKLDRLKKDMFLFTGEFIIVGSSIEKPHKGGLLLLYL